MNDENPYESPRETSQSPKSKTRWQATIQGATRGFNIGAVSIGLIAAIGLTPLLLIDGEARGLLQVTALLIAGVMGYSLIGGLIGSVIMGVVATIRFRSRSD